MEERRAKVSTLMLRGVRGAAKIAEVLGVSHDTIQRDIAAIESRLSERSAREIAIIKSIDLERLDTAIAAVYPRAINRQDKGQVSAARVMTEMIARKAAMLGYDAPQKTAQTITATVVGGAEPFDMERLTPEQAKELYDGMMAALPGSGEAALPSGE